MCLTGCTCGCALTRWPIDHFHVHIVNANYIGLPGMNAGQAHLLEDLISLVSITTTLSSGGVTFIWEQLELSDPNGPTLLQRMTFTYGLGEQHGLFEEMKAAQEKIGIWLDVKYPVTESSYFPLWNVDYLIWCVRSFLLEFTQPVWTTQLTPRHASDTRTVYCRSTT